MSMQHQQALANKASERYLLGEMSEPERFDFEAHYFDCPACADDVRAGVALARGGLTELQHLPEALKELRVRVLRPAGSGLRHWMSSRPATSARFWSTPAAIAARRPKSSPSTAFPSGARSSGWRASKAAPSRRHVAAATAFGLSGLKSVTDVSGRRSQLSSSAYLSRSMPIIFSTYFSKAGSVSPFFILRMKYFSKPTLARCTHLPFLNQLTLRGGI